MSGDTKRVLEVNQIDNLQGSTQRVKQETTLNNLRGVTQRVYVVGGGGGGNIDELNVTPSTSAQTITASGGVDGYSPVNVAAVDASIDANITAGNIKKDVSILGVTGSYEGVTPTGTMYIISNGTYNVADKAIANVQVPTTAPAHYIEKTVDGNGMLKKGNTFIDLTGVSSVESTALYYAFYGVDFANPYISLSPITTISGTSAFYGCFQSSKITTLNADTIKTITNNANSAFVNFCSTCSLLTTASFNGLEIINSNNSFNGAFNNCTQLSSLSFDSLVYVLDTAGNTFQTMCMNNTSLTSMCFHSLKALYGAHDMYRTFRSASNLATLSFPALTSSSFGTYITQFEQMCQSVTNVTIHFPSNVQSVIEGLTGYSTTKPFGATAGTVLFDLPATIILTGANSQAYERSPKDDTGTALAWRKQDTGTAPNFVIDWTPFYTNGLTDPQVNDTIYSDSACTTAVTTISSIA